MMLMVGTVGMAQEQKKPSFENSKDYQELLGFYKKTMESGKQSQVDLLRKEYLNKFEKNNFTEMKDSGLSMLKWLENNLKKTNFKSIDEASALITKIEKLDAELKEDRSKIQPIFSKLSKEFGTAALFKKISEDLKTEI